MKHRVTVLVPTTLWMVVIMTPVVSIVLWVLGSTHLKEKTLFIKSLASFNTFALLFLPPTSSHLMVT